MRKLSVALLMLVLMGVAVAAEKWQAWTSPDSKYSLDVPSTPEKVKDEGGVVLWNSRGEGGLYLVASVDEASLGKMKPAEQDQLAQLFAQKFFEGAEVVTSSEKKIADGYEYVGVMGEAKSPVAAQVRKSGSQARIYILLAVGQTDAARFFTSFKAN